VNLVRLLLESVGVVWLAVVGAQYALVMLLPDAPDLSPAYLPLLASTLFAGIMTAVISRRGTSDANGEQRAHEEKGPA
jgi:hypothetical protein